jgi:hypothetical protein
MPIKAPRVDLDADGNPIFIDALPEDFLRTLLPSSPADVSAVNDYRLLYGLDDPSALRKFETQYLNRFGITPTNPDGTVNPNYQNALKQLSTESNSKRVAVAQARRSAQVTETLQASDGNLNQSAVYINDGPDPCENCLELNGEEMTIAQFKATNTEPGDRCLGGDNCLCILVPIN